MPAHVFQPMPAFICRQAFMQANTMSVSPLSKVLTLLGVIPPTTDAKPVKQPLRQFIDERLLAIGKEIA
jgi:hypothetical protein